jgi:phosphoribosylpyrophosphate synthetase
MKLVAGNSNRLADAIGSYQTPAAKCIVRRFADDGFSSRSGERPRRGRIRHPVDLRAANDRWMELLIIIDALKRASPGVPPSFPISAMPSGP